ncbi:PorP/SprF family type IX secretion system membrane protein [Spongiivirga citrea]|uniref:Type IX secretion system membrane protein PorP/SprF n=1 Tax=Spongiivirga citrea TaxID=1481457 RepID=A0A6M0CIE1_9FLAO|nr:type IX secretion system membrane protein PorP/SprF [Spongiivirga citrea]NER17651.1 type IX secretion system membrane protein PorP/SprF [Spongiivirga citrea]
MKKKYVSLLLVVITTVNCYSQQNEQFTQYMYNTIAINPAYAGSREALSIIALNRNQWIGVEGAPVTQTISINTPLRNDRVGVGVSFINDQLGFEKSTKLYGDLSYTIPVSQTIKASFGLKAGANFFNFTGLTSATALADPYIAGINKQWTFNFGVGGYLHSEKFYVGLSAPKLLTNDRNRNADFETLEQNDVYVIAGYVFDISETVKFRPTSLLQITQAVPISYNFTGSFLLYDKLWLGASYRVGGNLGNAIGALADFKISDQFRVGYAYESPLTALKAFTRSTHEILLIYEFSFVKNKMKSPRYF